MATSGKIIKGKWRIDARLGSGATATVYAATHRNGYRVAIKMLHLDLSRDLEIRNRFLREGYVANTIQHKGIVRVLDDDVTEDGQVFLVLELLEGESLAAMLQKNGGRLPWMMVAEKMIDLLDVLSTAHAQGVVHRDIKPDNVFITTDGTLKVLDFGLARLKLGGFKESTRTGAILGTPDFMSPEQAAGKNDEVDARSDLYSVGATAYVLMSGQPVHTASTLQEHLQLTANTDVKTLAKAAPWVPFQLVGVIDRALARDKQKRWATAFEMQGALKAAMEEADVVLVPDAPTVLDPEPSIPPAPMAHADMPAIAPVAPAAGTPAKVPSVRPAAVVPPASRAPTSTRPPPSGAAASSAARAPLFSPSPARPANLVVPSAFKKSDAPEPLPGSDSPTRQPPPPSEAGDRSVTRTPVPSRPVPASVRAAAAAATAPPTANGAKVEEEEELIQRPDAPTIMDPSPLDAQEEQEKAAQKPLAKWTERLLEAEAAETAVSRGMVHKSQQGSQPPPSALPAPPLPPPPPPPATFEISARSDLQRATPVGPISRPMNQRQIVPVPLPPGHDPSAPHSIRVATKFEVDDTMQSPQAQLVMPGHQQVPIVSAGLPLPPVPMPPPPSQKIEPYVPPPPPPSTTSSSVMRIVFYGLLLVTAIITYVVVRKVSHPTQPGQAAQSGQHTQAPVPTASSQDAR